MRKARKEGNLWAERIGEEDDSRDHFFQREKTACSSLVLKRTEKQACSGCKKLVVAFSFQVHKQGCKEDK
jgi:hypothetical protein